MVDRVSINAQPLIDATSVRALALLAARADALRHRPADLDARLDAQLGAWLARWASAHHGASHGLGHALPMRAPHGITSCAAADGDAGLQRRGARRNWPRWHGPGRRPAAARPRSRR
jgi:hypothetical protein